MTALLESILRAVAIEVSVVFFVVCVRAEMGHYYPDDEAIDG